MKRYQHLSEFEPQTGKALKEAKAKTGLPINQLLNLCVRRALPGVCADLEHRPDYQQDVDWSDLLNRRQRKPKHSIGQVCKEIRALSNRRSTGI